ncbi:hypothetical protein I3760_01G081600 [Carya illinoinensis]|nr:hypothetical protein I3760_01G081600 [Carya illinoinensis]
MEMGLEFQDRLPRDINSFNHNNHNSPTSIALLLSFHIRHFQISPSNQINPADVLSIQRLTLTLSLNYQTKYRPAALSHPKGINPMNLFPFYSNHAPTAFYLLTRTPFHVTLSTLLQSLDCSLGSDPTPLQSRHNTILSTCSRSAPTLTFLSFS